VIPAEKLSALSVETLENLNRAVVSELRHRYAMKQRVAMMNLQEGQLVRWWSRKHGRNITVRITEFNRKTVTGVEVNEDGTSKGKLYSTKWRVSPSMVEVVPQTGT
jgi:hypothetical protein